MVYVIRCDSVVERSIEHFTVCKISPNSCSSWLRGWGWAVGSSVDSCFNLCGMLVLYKLNYCQLPHAHIRHWPIKCWASIGDSGKQRKMSTWDHHWVWTSRIQNAGIPPGHIASPCRDFSCNRSHSTPECDEAFSTYLSTPLHATLNCRPLP